MASGKQGKVRKGEGLRWVSEIEGKARKGRSKLSW